MSEFTNHDWQLIGEKESKYYCCFVDQCTICGAERRTMETLKDDGFWKVKQSYRTDRELGYNLSRYAFLILVLKILAKWIE